jgi:Ca2+-binding RTX toxin-like protein
LTGGAGADTIKGFAGADTVDGGNGLDTLVLNGTSASLNSAADAQLAHVEAIAIVGATTGILLNLSSQTESLIITATAFADSLTGGAGADSISAGLGDDVISGFAGADTVDGGAGTDTLLLTTTLSLSMLKRFPQQAQPSRSR